MQLNDCCIDPNIWRGRLMLCCVVLPELWYMLCFQRHSCQWWTFKCFGYIKVNRNSCGRQIRPCLCSFGNKTKQKAILQIQACVQHHLNKHEHVQFHYLTNIRLQSYYYCYNYFFFKKRGLTLSLLVHGQWTFAAFYSPTTYKDPVTDIQYKSIQY